MKVRLEKSKDPNRKSKIRERNIGLNFSFKSNFSKNSIRSLIGQHPEENDSKLPYLNDLR